MPTYDYTCVKCEHVWEELRKISESSAPLENPCPHCGEVGNVEKRIFRPPLLGDPIRLGIMKTDNGFKDVMRSIHERTPGSQLDKTSSITKL